MVGLYESSVDFLSETEHKIKYIASTATIKRGSDQVKSLFDRDLQVFPPNGVDVDDRFFISTKNLMSISFMTMNLDVCIWV